MINKGEDFNQLINIIEKSLYQNENASYKTHVRLKDKQTDDMREFDIIVYAKIGHRTLLTSIECKNLRRKIDIPLIEAYSAKCRDTGIDRAVIVSSVGFSKGALKKAFKHNIDCLSLREADLYDWQHCKGITMRLDTAINYDLKAEIKEKNIQDLFVSIDNKLLGSYLHKLFHDTVKPYSPEKSLLEIPVKNIEEFLKATNAVINIELKKLIVQVTYQSIIKWVPFSYLSYKNHNNDETLASIGSAALEEGLITGTLLMIEGKEGTTVSFVPNKLQ